MRLELAVEMRRLKIFEGQLTILEREAAEVAESLISDTREGHSTISLRWMASTIQGDVRAAIKEWDATKQRIAEIRGEPQLGRHRARFSDKPNLVS